MANLERARRALRKPPHVVARRLAHEVLVEAERVRAPRRAASFDLLRATGAGSIDELWNRVIARAPFAHGAPAGSAGRCAGRVLARAEHAVARRVDLLGSGPVELGPADRLAHRLQDGRSRGRSGYAARLDYADLDRPSDVKVPWEISRVQWLLPAGQAYLLTGEERYAAGGARRARRLDRAPTRTRADVNWAIAMEPALRIFSWSWLLARVRAKPRAGRTRGFRERFLRTL